MLFWETEKFQGSKNLVCLEEDGFANVTWSQILKEWTFQSVWTLSWRKDSRKLFKQGIDRKYQLVSVQSANYKGKAK